MNLHEYQSKQLFRAYDVPVPLGAVITEVSEAMAAARQIQLETDTDTWAVKAQVHAGGRGKGGGVKIAKSLEEVVSHAGNILGMQLITPQTSAEGKKVRKVYIEEGIYYEGPSEIKEFYLSLLLDRKAETTTVVYSPRGGMDIEKVAEETPQFIFREAVSSDGLDDAQGRMIADNLGLEGEAKERMVQFVFKMVALYQGIDASLVEVNPVVKTSDDKIIAADAKVVVDDNALFRHEEIAAMRDLDEENPTEVEAGSYGLNYVKMDGNVGCMVNGAGLAMATMDIIKLAGGEPANFLDVGGSANAERVEQGFRIITSDPNVKAILVNIFGGIVRCDRVANGVVNACKHINGLKVPIIVRLQGTNAKEGKEIIDASGLKVFSAVELEEAAELVRNLV